MAMDQLTLKPRDAVPEVPIENWDDEDLDIGGDDLTFRSASLATTASHHRESVSSRLSIRSDHGSFQGDDEKQVHLPGDDEISTFDAIATATRAGIPIPNNVTSSALMGGTIKRLGGRKITKLMQDDWDDGDLELPRDGGFKVKRQDGSNFPDALRQVSGPSPLQPMSFKSLQAARRLDVSSRPQLKAKPGSINLALERCRDAEEKVVKKPSKVISSNVHLDHFREEEDDDFFGDGGATIKVAKNRTAPKIMPFVTPPTPSREAEPEGDFEQDFQFPSVDQPLRLSTRRDIPGTSFGNQDEFDEWGEGSLGTRFGGTRREDRSTMSSSTAMSPSVASSLTVESEDEGLDGIILPNGPIPFDDILRRRQKDLSPNRHTSAKQPVKRAEVKDDFLYGLEIGNGDLFNSKKLTLNSNIKMKTYRPTSPSRPKTAVSLTFTNKPQTTSVSRLPRPLGHDRVPWSLEPVSESGGPIPHRRSETRLGTHSSQPSISGVTTLSNPLSVQSIPPSTPRRLANQLSNSSLRNESTNSQILKLKRSLPTMRSMPLSPAKPSASRYTRPLEATSRPLYRPKTPVERGSGAQSSLSVARKNPLPFIPAGAAHAQSHHIINKPAGHGRRNDSESSNASVDLRPMSRAVSRTMMRSPSPRRAKGVEALAKEVAVKRQMTKPVRGRHFGDGAELDGFDELPTSRHSEQLFIKAPIGCGPPKQRGKAPVSRTSTPIPVSPPKEHLPSFARDTNASRMAREAVLSQRAPSASGAPPAALTCQWKAKVSATTGSNSVNAHGRSARSRKNNSPQKPQLIKPLGNVQNPKSVKGMVYNPVTFRWEGNEDDLYHFDTIPAPTLALPPHIVRETAGSPSGRVRENAGSPSSRTRENQNSTPRPALITNINSTQNVQRVGTMVFDPVLMCWLKVPSKGQNDSEDAMDGFDALDEEDEDVFKDVPDLQDFPPKGNEGSGCKRDGANADWLVGEEFDVGPEFVRRQREEEDRWRKKCNGWISDVRNDDDAWRWSIRDVVGEVVCYL